VRCVRTRVSSVVAGGVAARVAMSQAEKARREKAAKKGKKPMVQVTVEYCDEDWDVWIICPSWAMHKVNGGDPSDKYEDEGGDSMWELYVKDHGEKKAKDALEERRLKLEAEEKMKNDARLEKLHDSFLMFDDDYSGYLTADEVLKILMRMTPDGCELTEDDAKVFIEEFDRNGDGMLDVNEFIIAMGVVSDAHDEDGDGKADMKSAKGGKYDGKEDEFAEKLAFGEKMVVAGMDKGVKDAIVDARKLQSV